MEPLPYRHLFHSEIQGDGLGILYRITRLLRKAKPQTVTRNWHYSDVDTVGGIDIFLCKDAEGHQYCVYVDCPPEHPPLKVRYV